MAHSPTVYITASDQHRNGKTFLARLLADPTAREARLNEIIAFLEKNKFQGLTVDFEEVPASAQKNLKAFLTNASQPELSRRAAAVATGVGAAKPSGIATDVGSARRCWIASTSACASTPPRRKTSRVSRRPRPRPQGLERRPARRREPQMAAREPGSRPPAVPRPAGRGPEAGLRRRSRALCRGAA